MTPEEAIGLGIFAINTLRHPDATSDADFYDLDKKGDEAIEALIRVRPQLREAKANAKRAKKWRKRFISLFNDVAACEAPEGTQVDDALAQYQDDYDKATGHVTNPSDLEDADGDRWPSD